MSDDLNKKLELALEYLQSLSHPDLIKGSPVGEAKNLPTSISTLQEGIGVARGGWKYANDFYNEKNLYSYKHDSIFQGFSDKEYTIIDYKSKRERLSTAIHNKVKEGEELSDENKLSLKFLSLAAKEEEVFFSVLRKHGPDGKINRNFIVHIESKVSDNLLGLENIWKLKNEYNLSEKILIVVYKVEGNKITQTINKTKKQYGTRNS